MNRGEIRWYTFQPPDKRRPVLILTRDEVLDHLHEIIVVPVTRTIRGLSTASSAVMLSHVRGIWVERRDASAANLAISRLRRRRETRPENRGH